MMSQGRFIGVRSRLGAALAADGALYIRHSGVSMRLLLLAAGFAVVVSPASAASLSSTVTLASDYLFDGVSQTQGDSSSRYGHPALQASLDLAFENGFYLGTWASNVDFGSEDPADVEIDFYGGYAWEIGNGTGFDVGVAHYTYTGAPRRGYDYTEVYFGVTLPVGTEFKLFVADDDEAFDGSTWRLKANHSFPLGADWSLDFEATRTEYAQQNEDRRNYWHGQLGVSRSAGPVNLYFGYSDTNLSGDPTAQGRFLFTLSTTFEIF
jgi:uncharacterized protein (TIGR02001 family)